MYYTLEVVENIQQFVNNNYKIKCVSCNHYSCLPITQKISMLEKLWFYLKHSNLKTSTVNTNLF